MTDSCTTVSLKNPNKIFSPDLLENRLLALGPGQAKRFLVALSGGLDSVVLLHALTQCKTSPLSVHAVHVNHNLQVDAALWADHCRQLCGRWDVPLTMLDVEVTGVADMGLEAAARRSRYDALRSLMGVDDILLTAHHQDDQAETFMLQLLRGSGVPGLASMPHKSVIGPGQHWRPLLPWSRAQLEDYARLQKLDWQEDPSNLDTRHARNYFRLEIMPVLSRRWPQTSEMISRSASHLAEAEELMSTLASADIASCRSVSAGLSRVKLAGLSEIRAKNLLRYYARELDLPVPNSRQLKEIIHVVFSPPRERHARICWPGAEARLYQDQLLLSAPLHDIDTAWRMSWDGEDVIQVPHTGWQLKAVPAKGQGLAAAPFRQARVTVGLRQGGERCAIAGRGPHHHSLKKLFQEIKMPPWARSRMPLVFVDNQLAAIGDLWICDAYAASSAESGIIIRLEAV